jgi:hypothetical protein
MGRDLLHLLTAGFGTKRTLLNVRLMSDMQTRTDIIAPNGTPPRRCCIEASAKISTVVVLAAGSLVVSPCRLASIALIAAPRLQEAKVARSHIVTSFWARG